MKFLKAALVVMTIYTVVKVLLYLILLFIIEYVH